MTLTEKRQATLCMIRNIEALIEKAKVLTESLGTNKAIDMLLTADQRKECPMSTPKGLMASLVEAKRNAANLEMDIAWSLN